MRLVYPHVTSDIEHYFTASQEQVLIADLKRIYTEEGRAMAAAKRQPNALLRQPGESGRDYHRRYFDLPDDMRDRAVQWHVHQYHRTSINRVLRLIAEDRSIPPYNLPPGNDLPDAAKALFADAWARYEATSKQAHEWLDPIQDHEGLGWDALMNLSPPMPGVTILPLDMGM